MYFPYGCTFVNRWKVLIVLFMKQMFLPNPVCCFAEIDGTDLDFVDIMDFVFVISSIDAFSLSTVTGHSARWQLYSVTRTVRPQ